MSRIDRGFIVRLVFALAAMVACIAAPVSAEMKKSQLTASNGIVVDVNSDDFADRAEYTAPAIRFTPEGGGLAFALVAKIKKSGSVGPLMIQGGITYSGDWRFYDTAIFKGGDEANFHSMGRDVGSCRYSCTLSEDFSVDISPEDIRKHAENGIIAIQIRAKSTNTAILSIPVAYIDAINEVAR
jgi:hypothetical protein